MEIDSIITPAVIASAISLAGVFGKEIWFDNRKNKRQTKILAIRLHFILSEYVLKCGKQLSDTLIFILNMDRDEHGNWVSDFGEYNIDIPRLNIPIETLDWIDLDVRIISSITKLIFDIQYHQININDLKEVGDYDDKLIDNTYIESISLIAISILDILDDLSKNYKIPQATLKIRDDSLKSFFQSKLDKRQ